MTLFRGFDFSLRQLQYALAVAEHLSFVEAARVCGVSQPSLSVQVAKLESALGVQLFERHARTTLVTEPGRMLLPAFREILLAAHDLREQGEVLRDPRQSLLRVGVIPTVAPYLLPVLVEYLRREDDGPRVHWRELQTVDCEQGLAAGELDAILIADEVDAPSLASRSLGWEPFFVVVPLEHELTGVVTPDQLSSHPVLLLEEGHCLRDHALELCLLPSVQESPFRGTSLVTVVQMVASGQGVSVIPASSVHVEVGRARVRALPFASSSVGRQLRLVWRERSPLGSRIEALAQHGALALQDAIAQVGDP